MSTAPSISYKALVVNETANGFHADIETLSTDELPQGSLLIQVKYSSLNYKDALCIAGNKGVTKQYPMTPGIDAAGVVVYSDSPLFEVGDKVIVTGNDLGMNTPGGFGQYIRVPAEWAIRLPQGLSLKEAMTYGTAGLTAGLSVQRLTQLVSSEQGKILVTGATGGVGTMSVAILSKIGYYVSGITGKEEEIPFLKSLGATDVIMRQEFMAEPVKPLLQARYSGAIDVVGGDMLAQVLRQIDLHGAVTCCGNVISAELNTSIYPFILRAITLIGISAQHSSIPTKQQVWGLLANQWKPTMLSCMCREIELSEVNDYAQRMLKGESKGRKVIRID